VTATDAGGRQAGAAHTAADGGYSIALAPGRYTLTVSTGSKYPICPPTDVTVESGKVTRADISCDSGMR
jgi:hypothetical protein